MHYIWTGLAFVAAAAVVAVSCTMNAVFWTGIAHTEMEKVLIGAASIALDIFKCGLPVLIAAALARRNVFYAIIGTPFFLGLFAAGILGAIGFLSANIASHTGARDAQNDALSLVRAELSEIDKRLSGIRELRSPATIEAELAGRRQDKRWTTSKECTEATQGPSREFCTGYFEEQSALATARDAVGLRARQSTLRTQVSTLQDAGAGQVSNPQVATVTRLLSWVHLDVRKDDVTFGISVFFALLIEFAAALGPYLALRHGALGPKVLKPNAETRNPKPLKVSEIRPRVPEISYDRLIEATAGPASRMSAADLKRISEI